MNSSTAGRCRPRVALVMVTIGDLSGSGGAERQFADLHRRLCADPRVSTTLITSREGLASLETVGRRQDPATVVALPASPPVSGLWRTARLTLQLCAVILSGHYDVVHICLPTPTFVPLAALLGAVPRRWRPAVTLNVIDCTLAGSYETPPPAGTYERQVLDAHRLYFRWARLDGIYSWYRSVVETLVARRIQPSALLRAARFCFADTVHFAPASKENLIVFAGRLSAQKRPLLFVDAVARLAERAPRLLDGVRIEMYGKGPLEAQVAERIARCGLSRIVSLTHAPDMGAVFARSRLFVSTQATENFTSLSMLEAMAAGNAVIAADVGQTAEFVTNGENGLLVRDETAGGFADAIAAYLSRPEQHARMADASRRIATSVHTIDHFTDDILAFWNAVLAGGPRTA